MIVAAMLTLLALVVTSPVETALAPPSPELENAVRLAVERIEPAIVTIETVGGTQPMFDERGQPIDTSTGQLPTGPVRGGGFRVADGPTTGIVFSADGLILTSSFNFTRDPLATSVRLADGRTFVAQIVARDRVRKLVLLRIEAGDLPVPEWTSREAIRGGQTAIALGRGFGGKSSVISVGIVSATRRIAEQAIQTDAKLSPANYGGPLVDLDGRVMGLCVPMGLQPGELVGVEWYDSGIGFAIPRDVIDQVAPKLLAGENIERGWLGVSMVQDVFPGVVIVGVATNSPAERIGLQPGDRIIALDREPVASQMEMMRRMNCRSAGEELELTITRRLAPKGFVAQLALYSELEFSRPDLPDAPPEGDTEPAPEEDPDAP